MKRQILILLALTMITARSGVFNFNGHKETWYDLNMNKVVKNAQDAGIPCEYWVREELSHLKQGV